MKKISFKSRGLGIILLILVLMGLSVATALADPPANDDFDSPTVMPGLPFSDSLYTGEATLAGDDPNCAGDNATVWYAFTPTENLFIRADTFGSDYDTTLSVYTGSRGALNFIACNDDFSSLQSLIEFEANAGETYYFMVGACCGTPGGNLILNIDVAPPPPPPLSMEFAPSSDGSVTPKTGEATLHGTMTCSRPSYANVFGNLKQKAGRAFISSFSSTFFICDGETSWSVTFPAQNGRFAGGEAEFELVGEATPVDDFSQFVQQSTTGTVTLKGKK